MCERGYAFAHFSSIFERIHGKIYMRKIKQRKGVNPDENNRFEQLNLFELCMGDDESSRGSETSEGKNNLLYTILKERNPEQLSNLEFQLYQEINSHFTQVL